MSRFYKRVESKHKNTNSFNLSFTNGEGKVIEVCVNEKVLCALDELQRELWRLDKREQRHSLYFETLPPSCFQKSPSEQSPEQIIIEQFENNELVEAISELKPKQKRRFLLQAFYGLTIKQIACIETCSESSVNESLALAKKNLREKLAGNP